MHKKTEDAEIKEDLQLGYEAAERVLTKANEAVNRDLLDEALEDLINRVDDWKNHRVDSFGKLLMHGVYGVITGKTDQEKDVRLETPPVLLDLIAIANEMLAVRNLLVRVYLVVL